MDIYGNGNVEDKKHEKRIKRNSLNPPLKLEVSIQCDFCDNSFHNNVDYALHSLEHSEDGRYFCHLCSDYRTVNEKQLELHVKSHDGTSKFKCEKIIRYPHNPPLKLEVAIQCDFCTNSYHNNVDYALHSIEHSSDGKYFCHICSDYRSANKKHLEIHVRGHDGTSKFKCEVCSKPFANITVAREHKYFHTGEKNFQCEVCGKSFMYSKQLSLHRYAVHYEIVTGKPQTKFDCKICGKHYKTRVGLSQHKLTKHTDEKKDLSVVCDTCGKRLSSKDKLRFHIRTHTGYKPYTCHVCAKTFTKKERLVEHIRIHTGEKPFICKHCGRGFSQRTPLKTHQRTHIGSKTKKSLTSGTRKK